MRTREQEYAVKVFERVQARATLDKKKRDAYGAMAHNLPVLIRTAGLTQALAFVQARHKEENAPPRLLLTDLAHVLGKPNLVALSRTAHLPEYLRLTSDTLQALLWFKRYAESVLGVDIATAATQSDETTAEEETTTMPQSAAPDTATEATNA